MNYDQAINKKQETDHLRTPTRRGSVDFQRQLPAYVDETNHGKGSPLPLPWLMTATSNVAAAACDQPAPLGRPPSSAGQSVCQGGFVLVPISMAGGANAPLISMESPLPASAVRSSQIVVNNNNIHHSWPDGTGASSTSSACSSPDYRIVVANGAAGGIAASPTNLGAGGITGTMIGTHLVDSPLTSPSSYGTSPECWSTPQTRRPTIENEPISGLKRRNRSRSNSIDCGDGPLLSSSDASPERKKASGIGKTPTTTTTTILLTPSTIKSEDEEQHGLQRNRKKHRRGRPRADELPGLMLEGSTSPSSIKCKYCERVFPRDKSLKAHEDLHLGKKPHLCDFPGCTRSFAQTGQLNTHQRLHTGERPFLCTEPGCGARFTHANRHCTKHPNRSLVRSPQQVLRPIGTNVSPEEKAWLERYYGEKSRKIFHKSKRTKKTASSNNDQEEEDDDEYEEDDDGAMGEENRLQDKRSKRPKKPSSKRKACIRVAEDVNRNLRIFNGFESLGDSFDNVASPMQRLESEVLQQQQEQQPQLPRVTVEFIHQMPLTPACSPRENECINDRTSYLTSNPGVSEDEESANNGDCNKMSHILHLRFQGQEIDNPQVMVATDVACQLPVTPVRRLCRNMESENDEEEQEEEDEEEDEENQRLSMVSDNTDDDRASKMLQDLSFQCNDNNNESCSTPRPERNEESGCQLPETPVRKLHDRYGNRNESRLIIMTEDELTGGDVHQLKLPMIPIWSFREERQSESPDEQHDYDESSPISDARESAKVSPSSQLFDTPVSRSTNGYERSLHFKKRQLLKFESETLAKPISWNSNLDVNAIHVSDDLYSSSAWSLSKSKMYNPTVDTNDDEVSNTVIETEEKGKKKEIPQMPRPFAVQEDHQLIPTLPVLVEPVHSIDFIQSGNELRASVLRHVGKSCYDVPSPIINQAGVISSSIQRDKTSNNMTISESTIEENETQRLAALALLNLSRKPENYTFVGERSS